MIIAGANVHDFKLLTATLEAIVVARPPPTAEEPQHLCLDKGYDPPTGHEIVATYWYTRHSRRIGAKRFDAHREKHDPPCRWVVERLDAERTLVWLSKYRGQQVRCEKNARNYSGLLQLACALIWIWRWSRLTGCQEPRG